MRKYSVWHDMQEQWHPVDIDPPAWSGEAETPVAAAEKLADRDTDDDHGSFIVRDDGSNFYWTIELVRSWVAKTNVSMTLADLRAP